MRELCLSHLSVPWSARSAAKGLQVIIVKLFHFQDLKTSTAAPLLVLLSLCCLSYKSHFKSPGISTLLIPCIDAAAVGSGDLHRSFVSQSLTQGLLAVEKG